MSDDSIKPVPAYPADLEECIEHRGRHLRLRPIRPADAMRHRQFLARVSAQDLYTRFFTGVRELPEPELARFTQVDYDRDMAFIAEVIDGPEAGDILGVARSCVLPEGGAAEFAVLVRSDLKRQGLGALLTSKLIRYCRARGLHELRGSVLAENDAMLALARALGFKVRSSELNVEEIALDLLAAPAAPPAVPAE